MTFHLVFLSAPYYIQLNLENKTCDSVILKWQLDGKIEELEIPKGDVIDKEIVLSGPRRVQFVKFSAVEKLSKERVNLNDTKSLTLCPTPEKALTKVLIEDGETISLIMII